MANDTLNAFAALMSALAAFAALAVALMSHNQSKKWPRPLNDGVPQEIRHVLVPFFVLYSDAFAAHRDGLLDERDWVGFSLELMHWSQKPTARRAWAAFRKQTWTEGFVDHVDKTIDGPAAYPGLGAHTSPAPAVDWPEPA